MNKLKYLFLLGILFLGMSTVLTSCGDDDDDEFGGVSAKTDYDVIEINGAKYACYGYRCPITYSSTWNLYSHSGKIVLPCGLLSDATKGEYDYDYMYSIYLDGTSDLKKGSKLENFSPTFENLGDWKTLDYQSGSATVTDKKDDKYITVKFDSFKFAKSGKSYTLNGTVQLDLDED